MSFIKNMFGGGSKPAKDDPKVQATVQAHKSLYEQESAKQKLEEMIDKSRKKEEQAQGEIDKLETEVKQLIMAKKKDKAKNLMKKIKTKKEMIIRYGNQANMLERQLATMDEVEENKDLMHTLKETNKIQKKNAEIAENLNEELMNAKELENEAKMRREEINGLMADDDEDEDDLDDMMKEYEDQINGEMALGFENADKGIISEKTKQPAQQQKAAPVQQSNFDNLMADLMN